MIHDILASGSSGNAVASERWVPVSGFEGLYEISDLGRMRSYKVSSSGKILSLTNKTGDYIRVVLQGIGKERKSIGLHRLVAMRFIPNPDELPEVNHIDGDKQITPHPTLNGVHVCIMQNTRRGCTQIC